MGKSNGRKCSIVHLKWMCICVVMWIIKGKKLCFLSHAVEEFYLTITFSFRQEYKKMSLFHTSLIDQMIVSTHLHISPRKKHFNSLISPPLAREVEEWQSISFSISVRAGGEKETRLVPVFFWSDSLSYGKR